VEPFFASWGPWRLHSGEGCDGGSAPNRLRTHSYVCRRCWIGRDAVIRYSSVRYDAARCVATVTSRVTDRRFERADSYNPCITI
jgi:hypothetical protein